MGAIASGLLLYGMSMIFGATQTLDIPSIAHTIHVMGYHHNPILLVGLIFLIAGVAFKLGVAPFHMWVPDVYDGAPAPVSMFIATAPKIAALVLFIRLFAEGLAAMHIATAHIVIVLAILSMAVGNIGALRQTQIKRLLGYSSIAHMGYILLALACGTQQGYASAYFYMISYAVMTLVAFGAISLLSRHGKDVVELGSLRGLNSQHPWLAFVLLMTFFSMAGIPPLVGFMAKLGILEALIHVHLTWLAVVAIIFAIIGAYYYLRVVKVMYFEKAEDDSGLALAKHGRLVLSLNGILVLVLGLMPGALFTLCHSIHF
jgi:NADH-quinone oxidoreductase subunit N